MSGGRGGGDRPLTYAGAYDASRTYQPREVATDGGMVFMALARTVGETPATSPSAWLLLGSVDLAHVEQSGAVGGDIPVFDAATNTWRPRGVNDALSTVATFRGARVTRTTNQDVPDSTGTVIVWTVESFDTDNFFDPAQPDRLTIPTGGAGKYQIIGIADFEQGTHQSNVRAMGLSVNGSNIVEPVSNAALAVHHGMFAPAMTALAAGDVITLAVYQNSSVTLPVSVTYTPPSLSLTYLGA